MDIRNCPRCGKMFTQLVANKTVCPNCEKLDEEEFKKVKDYIDENHHATLEQICNETEVSVKRVSKYIREGRLEISQGLRGDFRCAGCGAPIATGKYCEKCFNSIKSELTDALRPADPNRSGKMHTRLKKTL